MQIETIDAIKALGVAVTAVIVNLILKPRLDGSQPKWVPNLINHFAGMATWVSTQGLTMEAILLGFLQGNATTGVHSGVKNLGQAMQKKAVEK